MDECLDEYIEIAEKTIGLLEELVVDINAHHTRRNVVRTAGTTASVAGGFLIAGATIAAPFTGGASIVAAPFTGGASIAAAPFTGGASIVALTGVGVTTGVAGVVTNLGTDVVDMIWTKKYRNELIAISGRIEPVAKRFASYLEKIEEEATKIFKKNGNEAEAFREALQILITEGKIGWKGKQIADIAANAGRNTSSTLLRNGGKAWQSMRVDSGLLATAFRRIGLDLSRRTAFNVMKSGMVASNTFFIIWNLISLVDSLDNKHPAVEVVEAQIKEITEKLNNLKDIRRSFNE